MGSATLRQGVLDAALAVFAEQGYERATIADIRARAGVSNGAVFHHFKSKEAIAEALYLAGIASFQAGLAAILERRPDNVGAAIRAAVAHHLKWNETHRDLAFFMYNRGRPDWAPGHDERIEQLNRDITVRIRAWLDPFIANGEVRPVSTTVLAACVVGPAHFVAHRWLSGMVNAPPSAFADELGDAACAALLLATTREVASGRKQTQPAARRLWGAAGSLPPAAAGPDLLARMMAGDLPLPQPLTAFGARLVAVEADRLTLTLKPAAGHLDGDGRFAGSAVAALLAAAAELAMLIVLPRGRATVAHQMSLAVPGRPAGNAARLRIDAAVVQDSGQAVTVEALLLVEDRVFGRATANALIVDRAGIATQDPRPSTVPGLADPPAPEKGRVSHRTRRGGRR